jgi:hypothetical protein
MLLTLLRLGDTTLHYTRVTSGLACTKNRVTVTLLGAEVVDRKATWVVKGEKANLDILLQKSVHQIRRSQKLVAFLSLLHAQTQLLSLPNSLKVSNGCFSLTHQILSPKTPSKPPKIPSSSQRI